MNFICLVAQFYVALYPVGGPNLDVTIFFEDYLAGPFLLVLYLMWKGYSWFALPEHRPLYIKIKDIDLYTGMRPGQLRISAPDADPQVRRESIMSIQEEQTKKGFYGYAKAVVQSVF